MTMKKLYWVLAICACVVAYSLAGGAPIVGPVSHLIQRNQDPSAGNGVQASIGQILTRRDSGQAWIKFGTAATQWVRLINSAQVGVQLGTTTVSGNLFIVGGALNEDGWTTLRQTADQDVTNAADQDSNTFTFAVTAGNTYAIEADLFMGGSNAANDAEFRVAVSAGTMTGRGNALTVSAADASVTTLLNVNSAANTGQVPVGTFSGSGFPTPSLVRFSWVQNTTSGTAKIQFGNLVTGVGIVSRMIKGSRVRWKCLNC